MIAVYQSQKPGLAEVQQLTPFLFLLTLILKVGVGRVGELCHMRQNHAFVILTNDARVPLCQKGRQHVQLFNKERRML